MSRSSDFKAIVERWMSIARGSETNNFADQEHSESLSIRLWARKVSKLRVDHRPGVAIPSWFCLDQSKRPQTNLNIDVFQGYRNSCITKCIAQKMGLVGPLEPISTRLITSIIMTKYVIVSRLWDDCGTSLVVVGRYNHVLSELDTC